MTGSWQMLLMLLLGIRAWSWNEISHQLYNRQSQYWSLINFLNFKYLARLPARNSSSPLNRCSSLGHLPETGLISRWDRRNQTHFPVSPICHILQRLHTTDHFWNRVPAHTDMISSVQYMTSSLSISHEGRARLYFHGHNSKWIMVRWK